MSGDTIEAFGRKWKRVWQEDEPAHEGYEHMNETWKQLLDVCAIYVPVEAEAPPVELARQVGDPPGAVTAHLGGKIHPLPLLDHRPHPAAPGVSLAALRAANVARQAEWDRDGKITPAHRGNELAGEVGEACNVVKKLERERLGIGGSRDTVEHLGEELADVLICVDLLAMQYGIDLSAALVKKFNATSEKMGLRTRLADRSES